MSFSTIIKEHKAASMHRRRELDKSKANVMSSLEDVSSAMLHNVEKSTRQVQQAQNLVEIEAKNLQAQTATFAKYAICLTLSLLFYFLKRLLFSSITDKYLLSYPLDFPPFLLLSRLFLLRQVNRWMLQYDEFNEALKELGDVVNWANVIESDMRFICKSLDNAAVTLTGVPLGVEKQTPE